MLFKRCKHEFVTYEFYDGVWSIYARMTCKHCHKRKEIDLDDLDHEIKHARTDERFQTENGFLPLEKPTALFLLQKGRDYYVNDYYGAFCTVVCNKYKKRGIDLHQFSSDIKDYKRKMNWL